jgi:hypothetical protein
LRLFLISILIFGTGVTALAQEREKRDSLAVKDTLTFRDFIPTGIRVGVDVLALIRSRYDDGYEGWEFNAEADVHRYFLAFEMGNSQLDLISDPNANGKQGALSFYSNQGTYFRIGADMNFLPRDRHGNVLFIGARYGRSIFSESLTTTADDPVWGTRPVEFHTEDASARWFEISGGLRVRLWKILWVGYTARYKFGLSAKDTGSMEPHDVPGYGSNEKNSTWGFNYLVLVRLPLRAVGK